MSISTLDIYLYLNWIVSVFAAQGPRVSLSGWPDPGPPFHCGKLKMLAGAAGI